MPNKHQVEKMVFPSECADMLGVAVGVVSAVKQRLNIASKKVFPSMIETYLKAHPEFTVSQVYPKKQAA